MQTEGVYDTLCVPHKFWTMHAHSKLIRVSALGEESPLRIADVNPPSKHVKVAKEQVTQPPPM
jgi:hypothetical protein